MPIRFAAAISWLLVFVTAGCERTAPTASAPAAAHPNIVLITLDTVRADHLGCYGYFRDTSPRIDQFAEQSVVFDQAFAPMATTLPSHTSLLTGFEPLEHGVLANLDDGGNAFGRKNGAKSFAELARAAGYATAAFVSAAPLKSTGGLNAGFDVYSEPKGATRDGAETVALALDWLKRQGRERAFVWVHLYDPHFPYNPKPPWDTILPTDADGAALDAWIAEREIPGEVQPSQCKGRIPTITRTAHNLYDAEIRYTDDLVGRVFDHVRAAGWWDEAVVVVVADHGEGLNQHGWPQHGRVWNEQLRVPLLIKFPKRAGIQPARFGKLTAMVDVIPTVCGRLGLSWAEPLTSIATGRDALSPSFREKPLLGMRSGRKCPDDHGGEFVLTLRDWRFHQNAPGGDLLFSRSADPHELRNVLSTKPGVAEQAARQTTALVELFAVRNKDLDTGAPRPPQKADEKLRRELAELGYAGSDDEPDSPKP